MRAELVVKSRSLAGSSDLTLLATIKPGLVPSLDSVTYKSRIKRLLKTLNGGRSAVHEYAMLRPLSDAVERVAKINSFRVAILEPEDKVLLAVTFDGTWESYIRVLWQKVGTLLDVIFCNTVGYVSTHRNSFEAWSGWVRAVQVETAFFYAMPGLTVEDVQYLRKQEALQRGQPPSAQRELEAVRQRVQSAETIAAGQLTSPQRGLEALRQGLQSLAVLYRLTDLYLPGSEDGGFLQRAAREVLLEFVLIVEDPNLPDEIRDGIADRFSRQLAWLSPADRATVNRPRPVPALPTQAPRIDRDDVQAGILSSQDGVTHGCLLLLAFDGADAAARYLAFILPRITRDATPLARGALTTTLALSFEGLRVCGLSEAQLALFPPEFREGMEARASMLGDFRVNHPRRWRLPLRNWNLGTASPRQPIELSAVHMVLQLRIGAPGNDIDDPNHAGHPLHGEITALASAHAHPGVQLLSVQPMRRYVHKEDGEERIVEHFGFADGDSQPSIDPAGNGTAYPNQVHLGELLLGHANEADPAPSADDPLWREKSEWLNNGSFLVVRKLRQYVDRLAHCIDAAATSTGLPAQLIEAKMMGRDKRGKALAATGPSNDFHYGGDPQGSLCPLHAHIRRANPRQVGPGLHEPPGRRTPRLMRRGMSYGPRYNPDDPADPVNAQERGLVFMAYNASIGEQFEVVQRWISGGNSSGGFSGHSDPFFGVAVPGEQRCFAFEEGGRAYRMALEPPADPIGEPTPLVRLEWGSYLFTPSIAVLGRLQRRAAKAALPLPPWSVPDGLATLSRLKKVGKKQGEQAAIVAWKAALEDPVEQEKFHSASLWAAIRQQHGGVVRTPYGVIVAERNLLMHVLEDPHARYSVSGYHDRLAGSMGEIYLGLDRPRPGCPYDQQSAKPNAAIDAITLAEAFTLAHRHTTEVLADFIVTAQALPAPPLTRGWELNLDVKEVADKVLARLCRHWFGLPDGPGAPLVAGSWRWDWQDDEPPIYPSHFAAPSRHVFQPNPGRDVEAFGRRYGKALTAALRRFIEPYRSQGSVPLDGDPTPKPARLTQAIFAAFPGRSADDQVARTLAGALMGFLPTVDGNLRLSLNEWLRDGTFWSLRAAWQSRAGEAPLTKANALLAAPLKQAMQLRPSPELVWRTVTQPHALGKVRLVPGDTVVLGIVSATQQCLAEGIADVSPIFGGDRSRPQHPVHACPGYKTGMGVMLGILAGFMDVKETMRPSPAPLAFTFEGVLPSTPGEAAPASAPSTDSDTEQARAAQPGRELAARLIALRERSLRRQAYPDALQSAVALHGAAAPWPPGAGSLHLLAIGDSWFAYWPQGDVLDVLESKYGYAVDSRAKAGITLHQMTDPADPRGGQLAWLLARIADLPDDRKSDLRAILLSGGGNDVVGDAAVFRSLLNPAGSALPPVNEAAVAQVVGVTLRTRLTTILDAVSELCLVELQQRLPILVHGYDYPVPDGRGIFSQGWLRPGLEALGYNGREDQKAIMQTLIDRLNEMQLDLLKAPRFAHVRHVDLRRTLSRADADYTDDWQNELHPTIPRGFGLVAERVAAKL